MKHKKVYLRRGSNVYYRIWRKPEPSLINCTEINGYTHVKSFFNLKKEEFRNEVPLRE